MILNRNDKCWCGSRLKYKNCHLDFDKKLENLKNEGCIVPTRDLIKSKEQIEGIRKSAKINNGLLDLVSENIKEGMTTEEINKLAHEYTISQGGIPATLNYDGFPKSICTSINDEVCHGIPSKDVVLKNGDIINVDATTILNGYYSDASRMFMIGEVTAKARKIVEITKECLNKAIESVKPWGFLGDIGAVIQEYAESNGYSVVRDFGGHGVGLNIHEEPFVSHFGIRGTDMILAPGMVFTIEPMINGGSHEIFIDEDNGWTAFTADGSLSAQWEHTILVTEDGIEIISK
ncbi:methionyl aminopeptidase [Clostridium tagluense]|uniref:methionyl aminopeptidase n=1 Tax=Clostridium tagluense TaxID=360422 RepID=UPI001C0DF042|nr:methionyl aminopeptidase [Clostridium tagluense]MBU3129091.1 methionyl aminopeptidase [Clostridium tagluense]MCB2311311.1 methionyl aminopeptidase [Clostridium tagluense]MCB2316047.1 methionyl aminopeptidase [Clostridium tagluense]MCB2320887.1 methionyl aminopeptidase [Clostridium tagluense]MCB2325916.1 methionyl aminopeptidase [Clostridium tagluense]